ncbi:MAG: deoxyhypusine synthase family protein [Planctomycetes bacterium]|nr:deoxyhypusine synthase family protein [Planctomycetota bacterium]
MGQNGENVYRPLTAAERKKKKDLFDSPVKQLAVTPNLTVADLVEQMQGMSIQARNVGVCANVLRRMLTDPDRPTILLGLAGPLIAAGLRKVIRDLIAGGAVDVVVSTGAVLYQDIYQARGFRHYQGTPDADDAELRDLYVDRIYDTYVDEEKFWDTDVWCGRVADKLAPGIHSSRDYLDFVGSQLDDDESIVRTCHKLRVPIFAPAINDSSIGIGLTHHHHRAVTEGRTPISIDSIRDNYEITQIVVKSKKTAAIYVAGGVPKNYINDSIVMSYIFGLERGHSYAIQVTTAVTQDGGLSGSTLSEARSWGKIRRDADFAMAWVEPSVSLPLLAGYVSQRGLAKNRPRLKFTWEGELLKELSVAGKEKVRAR